MRTRQSTADTYGLDVWYFIYIYEHVCIYVTYNNKPINSTSMYEYKEEVKTKRLRCSACILNYFVSVVVYRKEDTLFSTVWAFCATFPFDVFVLFIFGRATITYKHIEIDSVRCEAPNKSVAFSYFLLQF